MTQEASELIIWRKADFPEGTIGRNILPDFLDNRERSGNILRRPFSEYATGLNRSSQVLTMTTGQLMATSEQETALWWRSDRTQYLDKLKKYLGSALLRTAISSEDKLMGDIFDIDPYVSPELILLPPEIEPARSEAI